MHGRYERKKPRKKKKLQGWKKVVLITAAVFIAIVALLVGAVVWYYYSKISRINHVVVPTIAYTQAAQETDATDTATEDTGPTETTEEATEPHVASSADYINFLLVGQAARDGEEERFADTAMLVTLNTYTKTVTLTSMLRDAFVRPTNQRWNGHEFGRIKLTAVYHLGSLYGDGVAGSMELMNLTLYNNFGIEVDHNFEVDFEAFVKIVNMIEGVEIEITEEEAEYLRKDDKVWQQDIYAGLCWMDGDTALAYARMRKAKGDNESDIIRTERQRKFMEAVLNKIKSLSLTELNALADEILPMITTSMSTSQITNMLLTVLPMLPELKLEKGGTCPAESWGDMVEIYGDGVYHSVLRFDETATKKTMRAITEGETE